MEQHFFSGYHTIEELLKQGEVSGVLVVSKKNQKILSLIHLAEKKGIKVKQVSGDELDKFRVRKSGGYEEGYTGGHKKNRGVLLMLTELPEKREKNLDTALAGITGDTALVLVLDGITDPRNFGAILRSADQFAVDLVIIPSRKSAGVNETVSKVSSGAAVYVSIVTLANTTQALEKLKEKGFWIYGADMDGKSIIKTDLKGRTAIVMGSEGKGLHRLVKEKCDMLVSIPSFGHVDSFNVSVASGIIMYEVRKQQGYFL